MVETDSYLYHRGKIAFQDDHARDLTLRGHGYDVLRLSEAQIADRSPQVAAMLARELGKKRPA